MKIKRYGLSPMSREGLVVLFVAMRITMKRTLSEDFSYQHDPRVTFRKSLTIRAS